MQSNPGKPRVFSGIQPSGGLHLGNYLGALRNWVRDQDKYDNIFCIVEQHTHTVPQDPSPLRENTLSLAAIYLASGIKKEQAMFVQSHIPAHPELAWILECFIPMGWLERMTQFKEKSGSERGRSSAGLFAYPALMAADILLTTRATFRSGRTSDSTSKSRAMSRSGSTSDSARSSSCPRRIS